MSSDLRTERSEAELKNASNDLYYEFWMFVRLANGLATGIMGESVINNALLESFVIHARVILDFLYGDRLKAEQVSALDFVHRPDEWIQVRPKMSTTLKEVEVDIRHRFAREIGHLGYDRHKDVPERKPWPFMQIAKEINQAFDAFLELVPERHLGPRWKEVRQQRGA